MPKWTTLQWKRPVEASKLEGGLESNGEVSNPSVVEAPASTGPLIAVKTEDDGQSVVEGFRPDEPLPAAIKTELDSSLPTSETTAEPSIAAAHMFRKRRAPAGGGRVKREA